MLNSNVFFFCRFAQFFLCPLFDESCKDREVNAVDSEHEKNLMNDAWRLFQLEKATGNPDHPFSKFGTGTHSATRTWMHGHLALRPLQTTFNSHFARYVQKPFLSRQPFCFNSASAAPWRRAIYVSAHRAPGRCRLDTGFLPRISSGWQH